MTALVGESGSGKSTLTNLLLRFWDVNAGSVSIGGVDVRDIPYDDLLASISIVMQDVRLFADTIEGNIRIGKADATHEEVVEAAKKACIHEFVMSLPQGYETLIGENGVGLVRRAEAEVVCCSGVSKRRPHPRTRRDDEQCGPD